ALGSTGLPCTDHLVGVTAVSLGAEHTLALGPLDLPLAGGGDNFGELGTGDDNASERRLIVGEPSESPPCTPGFEASAVDAGLHTSAALRTGLGLATWGADGVGQLGRGGVGETNKPSHECGSTQNGSCVVDLIGVEQFDMSTDYGHLRLSSGIVHGWGDNSVGTLGV